MKLYAFSDHCQICILDNDQQANGISGKSHPIAIILKVVNRINHDIKVHAQSINQDVFYPNPVY